MDPTNNTPVEPNVAATTPQTPPVAPVEPAASAAPAAPVSPVEPVAPVDSAAPANSAAPVVTPAPAPTAPVTQPVSTPSTAPVNADVENAALNPPVNPVVAPGTNQAAQTAGVSGTMSMNQMFQAQPANQVTSVIDETTAIAVPEGPKPPDPVEEELKAPLKAAGPVPGSIGSSVSMPPADGNQPQTNGVNEQMMAQGINPMATNANSPAGKKLTFLDKLTTKTKMTKNTLILLSVVAGLIVIALVIVLIMGITGSLG